MWVPGSRPNRGMDVVPRRSHHSPKSCVSVSCTTDRSPTFLDYLLSSVVVCYGATYWATGVKDRSITQPRVSLIIRGIVPWQVINADRNASLESRTHTLSSPSSLIVVLVGSSVPILYYKNLACRPRYPIRKGKCCQCRVEPGVLPSFGVDGRTSSRLVD